MGETGVRPTVETAAAFLSRTTLLVGMRPAPLAALAAHARVLDVAARAVIYRRDDVDDRVYFVVSGGPVETFVPTARGAEIAITEVGQLGCFGELTLLDRATRSDTARAVERTRLLSLPREQLLATAATDAVIMRRLFSGLGGNVRRVIDQARDASFGDLHERIVLALVEVEARIARGAPAPTLEDLQRQLPVTVGAPAETVDEVLRSFEELGYLEARRDHVRISSGRPEQGILRGGLSWTALVNQVLHDPLTQLANRMLFHERLRQAVTDDTEPTRAAVLMIDLDGFKGINDTLGHAAGDELLVKVADRLRGCLRRPDTPARLGGDEFAVVVTEVDSHETATRVADRVLTAVARPFMIQDEVVAVGASIGIALSRSNETDEMVALLGRADAAMYRAKRAGKRRWEMETDGADDIVVEAPLTLPERIAANARRDSDPEAAPSTRDRRGVVPGVRDLADRRGQGVPASAAPSSRGGHHSSRTTPQREAVRDLFSDLLDG